MTEVAKQLSWIWNLLSKLKFQLHPIPLLVDNQGAIFLASNPAQEGCTKHIEIPEHFIHEYIHAGKIKLYYVPTTKQVADTFTKNLTWQHVEKLWMIPYSSTTWTARWSVEVLISYYWLCSLFICQSHSQSRSQSQDSIQCQLHIEIFLCDFITIVGSLHNHSRPIMSCFFRSSVTLYHIIITPYCTIMMP